MSDESPPDGMVDVPAPGGGVLRVPAEFADQIKFMAVPTDRRALLAAIPAKYSDPKRDRPETISLLPKPLSKDAPKSHCDVCGGYHGMPAVHIDYQGHADVTLALLDVDPEWSWRPAARNPVTGGPAIDLQGGRLVMWAFLTVHGFERECVGTCGSNQPDSEKELIGDMLRNGAMRFGIATRLWSKADRADPAGTDAGGGYQPREPRQQQQRQTTTRQPAQQQRGRRNDPPPTPPAADDINVLTFERVTAIASNAQRLQAAQELSRLRGRKLTKRDFSEHEEWRTEVIGMLDRWDDEDRAAGQPAFVSGALAAKLAAAVAQDTPVQADQPVVDDDGLSFEPEAATA